MDPFYSLVMEWDNPLFGNAGEQQERVLSSLSAQVRAYPRPGEVIVLFDSLVIEGEALGMLLRRYFTDREPSGGGVELRMVPTAGKRYYAQKNAGTREARGEVVVFVDSDVVAEPDWLSRLLRHFEAPEAGGIRKPAMDVVAGMTYIEPSDTYSRVMGMIWIFPARSAEGEPFADRRFWANNVAMRREVALRFPFPERGEQYRGKLSPMTNAMRKEGVGIWRDPSARTMHPPPEPGDFQERAIHHGSDRFLTQHRERKRKSRLGALFAALGSVLRGGVRAQQRISAEWEQAGLKPGEVGLARRMGFSYHAWMVWGVLRAASNPEWQREGLQSPTASRLAADAS